MKKIMTAIVLLCIGLLSANATENKSVKLAFKDYSITDQELRPMSIGLCTWSDSETSCDVAGYFDIAIISMFNDRLRLGTGLIGKPRDDSHWMDIKMETSITTRFDWFEVGAYYCPFWGLADKKYADDPAYGIMIGYSIKL